MFAIIEIPADKKKTVDRLVYGNVFYLVSVPKIVKTNIKKDNVCKVGDVKGMTLSCTEMRV